ncbi:MAG: hypothetical protein HONBIEJF_00349 [Fimbriimonadaceae bacterium]|nr:hypothetical protein [Fimbriimonadaceae bacterium]
MMTAAFTLGALTVGLFVGGDVQGGLLDQLRQDDPLVRRPGCGMHRPQALGGIDFELTEEVGEVPPSRRVEIPDSSLTFRFPTDLDLQSEEQMSGEGAFDKISTYIGESANCVAVVTVSNGKSLELTSDTILVACSAAIVEGLREQGFTISDFKEHREKLDARQSIWMSMLVDDGEIALHLRVRLIDDDNQLAVTTILSIPQDRTSEAIAQEAFESIRFWKG